MATLITKPIFNLRQELKKNNVVDDAQLKTFYFSGNGSLVSFSLSAGFEAYAVYVGGLRKSTSDYTISYDLDIQTITFTSAPASGTSNIAIDARQL